MLLLNETRRSQVKRRAWSSYQRNCVQGYWMFAWAAALLWSAKGRVFMNPSTLDPALTRFTVLCTTVQLSSVPWPIGMSGGWHDARFSRDPLPVFSAGGYCEQVWYGQGMSALRLCPSSISSYRPRCRKVMAFSSLARILGVCSSIHSPPALFLFLFFEVEINSLHTNFTLYVRISP